MPQASPREGESPVEGARRLLETAILIGGVVVCPGCGEACEKDDACMHMECRCGARGALPLSDSPPLRFLRFSRPKMRDRARLAI